MTVEIGERLAHQVTPDGRGALPVVVRGFRPDIQGLRAVAVVLVVLYHSAVPLVTGGFIGVDVFFVISGFLITQHLMRETQATGSLSLSKFYARRIRRLLPSALLVIVVTVTVARMWGPALQATSTARDGLFATFYSLNYWLATEGVDYQHAASAVSPLQHFWSLAVEEQYYLIWPVVILVVVTLLRRRPPRARSIALFVVIVAITAVSFGQSVVVTASDAPLAYFSLQTRGWELGAGALVAIAASQLAKLPNAVAASLSWSGIAAIMVSAVAFSDETAFPSILAGVPVVGAVLIIASGLVERRGSVERILAPRGMQFLGTVSYGWYLWHWPLIVLGPFLFHTTFGWAENLEVSVLALWLGVMSYLVLERSVLKRPLLRRPWYLRGAVASILVAALAAALIVVAPPALAGTGASAAVTISRSQTALTSQLTSALREKQIPSNLSPTLARADTDVPVTSRDSCHLDYATTTNAACVFGDTSADRTILLFGDSHAQQWFGAVNAYAVSEHWKLVSWTKAACPVADMTVQNEVLKRAYGECDTWRAATLKDIATLRPDVVIASQADALAGDSVGDRVWGSKTAATLAVIKRIAPTVIYLEDTPHPMVNPADCLAANSSDRALCNVSTSLASLKYLRSRRAAVAASLNRLGIPVVDPTPWFCVRDACPSIVGSALVYRDISHISQTYIRTLEPILAEALRSHLPTPASK